MYMENRDCSIYFLDKLNQIKYFNSEKTTIATTSGAEEKIIQKN